MAVFLIDTDKPEAIQMLAKQIANYMNSNPTDKDSEWIGDLEARTILGGGKKPIAKKTLRVYRDQGIEHRELGPKKFLYKRSSIMRFIETH